MRNALYILFLLPVFAFGQTRYVTSGGSSGNGGTNDTSDAWDLQTGLNWLAPGRTLYVKAGTYTPPANGFIIPGPSSGDVNNPAYVIGYTSSAPDITADAETTVTEGNTTITRASTLWVNSSPNAATMPLIQGTFELAEQVLLTINANNIHFYNFQFRYGEFAISQNGSGNTFKNIFSFDQTEDSVPGGSGAPYFGKAIVTGGDNNDWNNVVVVNSGAQGFTVKGGNNSTFNNVSVFCDDVNNPTDYYMLVYAGVNNTFTNIYVERTPGLAHNGHGIVIKPPVDNPVTDADVNGFIILGTYLEVQFPGAYNNNISNGYILNVESSNKTGGIRVANNAHDNTFSNIYLDKGSIKFQDWDDGRAGEGPNNTTGTAGYNNVFNQIITDGNLHGIMFNDFGDGFTNGTTYNNTFYNCTFYNHTYLFESARPNSGTTLINCVVDNVANLVQVKGGYSLGTVTYTRTNFSNIGFTTPTGTNITEIYDGATPFTNAAGDDFSVLASLQDIGNATPFLAAGNDLGADQGGGTPPGDVIAPTVSGFSIVSTLENEIVVEWNLDEGGTGQVEYDIDTGVPYANTTTLEPSYLTYHRQRIRNLSPGTTYYFRATGADAASNTYTSSELSTTTLDTGTNPPTDPPPAPITSSTRQKGDGVYLKTKKNQ